MTGIRGLGGVRGRLSPSRPLSLSATGRIGRTLRSLPASGNRQSKYSKLTLEIIEIQTNISHRKSVLKIVKKSSIIAEYLCLPLLLEFS